MSSIGVFEVYTKPCYSKSMVLADSFGRNFNYLRLSITDACNFRCVYCLPDGFRKTGASQYLTCEEIGRLGHAFHSLGFEKVRVTGGEPTLRTDLLAIIRTLREVGFRKVCLSTNGWNLKFMAKHLKAAGLNGVNVSIDSLDPNDFNAITGRDLSPVLDGVLEALEVGLPVKVNSVLLKEFAERTFWDFVHWTKTVPVTVRFIELMETGDGKSLFGSSHLSASWIQNELIKLGWRRQAKESSDGPAVVFSHEHFEGRMGIIAPYSEGFCEGCNRLRITSKGELSLCLFGTHTYPLRNYLTDSTDFKVLMNAISSLLVHKKESHFLDKGDYGRTQNFAAIGG